MKPEALTDAATVTGDAAVPDLAALERAINDTLLVDRGRLRRRLRRLRRDQRRALQQRAAQPETLPGSLPGSLPGPLPRSLPARHLRRVRALVADIERSRAVVAARQALAPAIRVPPELPVAAHADELVRLITTHQVVIVTGATGSGKSTQLPKLCLTAGRGIGGRIGHTQPRRIAARAIAARIATETGTAPGSLAAHCVRFDDNVTDQTRIKLMTDGILLNEIRRDRWLEEYDTLIIDEAHERSLNIDVLLGYLPRVLERRPDFRLVITSATLDSDLLAARYQGCAVHAIEGRGYPIEIRYRPPEIWRDDAGTADDDAQEDPELGEQVLEAIRELDAGGAADVLVFLPGEREIREVASRLERARLADTELLRLYARLSAAHQARVFAPGARRRIVLATNVAETSLTVPRIRHVIDSGLARVSRYSPRRKLQQLPIEPVPRANAEQRAGRCGREAPGICIRLYAEEDYARRRRTIEPEILRTNLADVILRLKSLGAGEVEAFPFVQPPATRLIKDGYAVLQEIGALDAERGLTALGADLSGYPVDPRLSRMLLAAAEYGSLAEVLIIVAALSISDPRERPHEARDAADRAHAAFADKRSDFLWFVRAFAFARELAALSPVKRRRACRRRFLSAARMQEWVQLHDHLRDRAADAGLACNDVPASYKAVHMALATGFPTLLAEWQQDRYHGCRGTSFALHPASVLFRRDVKWILAADIVETARPYARLAARFEPVWMERVAPHLLRRSHEAPHWDEKRGVARVTEIVRLLGLVIHGGREVELGRIDRSAARQLLIDEGLVGGRLGELPAFLDHNLREVQAVRNFEARTRRRDLVAGDTELRAFYDTRLPAGLITRRALLGWLRADAGRDAQLTMTQEDVTGGRVVDVPEYLFPDELDIAGTRCPLTYRFEPGHEADGLTVRVPLWLLPRVAAAACDRLVPGMLSEKVEAVLRAMPKPWRRRFVPAAEYAMAVVEALPEVDGSFAVAVAAILSRIAGTEVPPAICDDATLPAHLRCRIEVIGDTGDSGTAAEPLIAGRDPQALLEALGDAPRRARAAIDWGIGGRAHDDWRFGRLAVRVEVEQNGFRAVGYPGLVCAGDAVEVVVRDAAAAAAANHGAAVLHLLQLAASAEQQWLRREYSGDNELALLAVTFAHDGLPHEGAWRAALARRAAAAAAVRDDDAFAALCADFRRAVVPEVGAAMRWMLPLMRRGQQLRLEAGETPMPEDSRADIESQLAQLLGPTLAWRHGAACAARYDHYLDALARRLERVRSDPGKDHRKLATVAPLWRRFERLAAGAGDGDHELADLQRRFEEFRVSVFAPELGTDEHVADTDLAPALAALENA